MQVSSDAGVILSGAAASRREAAAQSKDPYDLQSLTLCPSAEVQNFSAMER